MSFRHRPLMTSVYEWHCSHACTSTLVMGRTLDLPSVIELAPCKYKRVYFYFGVQKKLIFIYLFFFYFYFLGPIWFSFWGRFDWKSYCWRFWSAIVPIHTSTINAPKKEAYYVIPEWYLSGLWSPRTSHIRVRLFSSNSCGCLLYEYMFTVSSLQGFWVELFRWYNHYNSSMFNILSVKKI